MHPQASKSLAVPTEGRSPSFDEVADIAFIGAFFDQAVCVICLTQDLLDRWMARLDALGASVTLLDILDSNRATLSDWKSFFGNQTYDLVVLHGARVELQGRRLSARYVKALVDAIPAGLVMLV